MIQQVESKFQENTNITDWNKVMFQDVCVSYSIQQLTEKALRQKTIQIGLYDNSLSFCFINVNGRLMISQLVFLFIYHSFALKNSILYYTEAKKIQLHHQLPRPLLMNGLFKTC